MNKRGGFTVVELVVVVVAVVVLAGLAFIGVTRFQANARDGQRGANVGAISSALESYFTENGKYPSCQAMTADASVLTSTLKGLDKSDLLVPGSQPDETNAIRCGEALALVGDDFIEYQGDGSDSCNGSGSCSTYKLIYRHEVGSDLKEIKSHGLAVAETVIDIPTTNTPSTQTPTAPEAPPTETPVSTTPTTTPNGVTATATSATQVTVSWTAVTKATGYTVKYGLTEEAATFSAKTKTPSLVISSNLTQGTEWFFKVYATVGGAESTGSTVAKVTTPINAPAAYKLTSVNDNMSLTGNAFAAACPSGTTKYYEWKANDMSWVQGETFSKATYGLSNGQGVTLTSAVQCKKGSLASGYTKATNSVTYTRPGMNLKLAPGDDDCQSDYCGRTINASWSNICGTNTANIKAKQLGSLASWKASTSSSDAIKWKGASGAGVRVSYYEVNIGCASAAASVNVISAYKCTGCN